MMTQDQRKTLNRVIDFANKNDRIQSLADTLIPWMESELERMESPVKTVSEKRYGGPTLGSSRRIVK